MGLKLYNTASRQIEEFKPIAAQQVAMYNCGPTVYNYAHVGNLRAYVFADVLRRVLEVSGYKVKQVVNITDVGHLVSDGDEGEDKMSKTENNALYLKCKNCHKDFFSGLAVSRESFKTATISNNSHECSFCGFENLAIDKNSYFRKESERSVEDIIAHYSDAFYRDLAVLNIQKAWEYPRATKFIPEQAEMIETLAKNGFTYSTTDGIYFDTSKFPRYAEFAHLDVVGMTAGKRVDMGEKKNSTDFALWKFSPADGQTREQEWDSPLGLARKGFPGWHIECSAIIKACLGETIDIHTGGIDHIPVHHTNEIAQSESANGVPLASVWMHSAFMNVDGQKMSKSLGNTYTLDDFAKQSLHPLDYRYWLLTAHYRTQLNFTWESLKASATAYHRLSNMLVNLGDTTGIPSEPYLQKFAAFIDDDLNTASALALMWDLMKDPEVSNADKIATIFRFDAVLGLELEAKYNSVKHLLFPPEVTALLHERKDAREAKNFAESDRLRNVIREYGFEVKDTSEGQQLEQI